MVPRNSSISTVPSNTPAALLGAPSTPVIVKFWGRVMVGVCLKPWQFSCWNTNDPNRAKLLAISEANRTFRTCLSVAGRALAGAVEDKTAGATHYHTRTVTPAWSRGRAPCAVIGGHLFYNDVE